MVCEICGRDVKGKEVVVEGAVIEVCPSCLRKIEFQRVSRKEKKRQVRIRRVREQEIVEDYAQRISKARQALGLSQEELARQLGIKESYLKHIEKGLIPPTLELAKKMEKVLNVSLIEEFVYEAEEVSAKREEKSSITLADLLEGEDGR